MFSSRKQLLDFMRDCTVTRRYSTSEQERLHKMFSEMRFYMGTRTMVRIDLVELTEMIRFLEGEGDGEVHQEG